MMAGGGVSNLGPGTGGLGPLNAGENLLCLGFMPLAIISLILFTATGKVKINTILTVSYQLYLTLLLLSTTCPVLANSVDPDQLASEEAN